MTARERAETSEMPATLSSSAGSVSADDQEWDERANVRAPDWIKNAHLSICQVATQGRDDAPDLHTGGSSLGSGAVPLIEHN